MEPYDCIPEILPVKVSINFCCENGLVSEHFLNSPEVGSSINQVGRKRMPESMWTDILLNP